MEADAHDLLLYLRDMRWRDVYRGDGAAAAAVPAEVASPSSVSAPAAAGSAVARLGELAAVASECRRCRLAATRRKVVFGTGNPRARLMFVGEGPGADEDAQGEPFVGQAGQLLTAMLRAIRLRREDVYIANVVKCRPPGNRNPEPDETEACLPYLRQQIELVNPAVIVLLGLVAVRSLLGTAASMTSLRGVWKKWEGRDVLPTFHPAYLLRNPAAKAQVWSDLRQLRAFSGPLD